MKKLLSLFAIVIMATPFCNAQQTEKYSAYKVEATRQFRLSGSTWLTKITEDSAMTANNATTSIPTVDAVKKYITGYVAAPTGSMSIPTLTVTTKLNVIAGANKAFNTAVLVAGTVTVTNTAVTTSSKIIVYLVTPGGTLGVQYAAPAASIVNGTSFVINSYQTTAAVQAADVSTVAWMIIN
jgi:hypothetical protein